MWNNNEIISGPYLAVEELKKRNQQLKILPLGKLPWATKNNSNFTSLAVPTKAGI
ncbi:MAG: hypothetical protein ACI8P3_004570 [Saprospiraceae bacterium]